MQRNLSAAMVAVLVLAALTAVLLPGCLGYKNPHGRQDCPHVIRIVTVPEGAELKLPDYNLVLITPADIERDIDTDDPIVITKEGYLPFRGCLADIPQIALSTYQVKLQPVQ